MNKLPLIEPKKKPNKYQKNINEDDKRKNNLNILILKIKYIYYFILFNFKI